LLARFDARVLRADSGCASQKIPQAFVPTGVRVGSWRIRSGGPHRPVAIQVEDARKP
jgi:hypothetical protein